MRSPTGPTPQLGANYILEPSESAFRELGLATARLLESKQLPVPIETNRRPAIVFSMFDNLSGCFSSLHHPCTPRSHPPQNPMVEGITNSRNHIRSNLGSQ